MNAEQRLYTAIDRRIPDRVPVVPKIWVDLAAKITQTSLYEVISNPETALRVIIDAGIDCIGPLDPLGGFTCRQVKQEVLYLVQAAQCLEIQKKKILWQWYLQLESTVFIKTANIWIFNAFFEDVGRK